MLQAGEARPKLQHTRMHRLREAQALVRQRCAREHLSAEELRMGGRRRRLSSLRAQLAVHLVTRLGLSLADAARQLGVSTSGIAKAVARAEAK
jgi:putative transposase